MRNRVRIIGGKWRSRWILFPSRRNLRPTPDRVRETLFNWLGQDLTGLTCLDLFAGSGALGFEAASRGAKHVVMVESDAETFRALQSSRATLAAEAVELRRADALEFLRTEAGLYDVVFLDPPFEAEYLPRLWELVPRHLAQGALVYCESALGPRAPSGWETWKQGRAGRVQYQLLKRTRP